jgi:anti-anti-sigma regulatory factor
MSSAIMIKLPELFGSQEARKLGQELKDKLTMSASPSVLVDLSQVKQIDLAGLEGLLDCMEIIANHDGALELGEISPEAATMLELTRMDRLFRKFPGFNAARSFTPGGAAESKDAVAEKIVHAQPVAA